MSFKSVIKVRSQMLHNRTRESQTLGELGPGHLCISGTKMGFGLEYVGFAVYFFYNFFIFVATLSADYVWDCCSITAMAPTVT